MKENHSRDEEPRGAGEKLWGATVKALHGATFKADQYKRIVQKKIDLNSIHKKISGLHCELGKMVDEEYAVARSNLMELDAIQNLLSKLSELKEAAATLEAELEAIKGEQYPDEEEHLDTSSTREKESGGPPDSGG